jgi:hypothetical protein
LNLRAIEVTTKARLEKSADVRHEACMGVKAEQGRSCAVKDNPGGGTVYDDAGERGIEVAGK